MELAEKKKLMVWLVSHCDTKSQREDYVAELQKHIPVDVYGKCGKSCGDRDDCGEILKVITRTRNLFLKILQSDKNT